MKVPRVFISMGTPYTPEQAKFRDDLESLLRNRCHVDARIIGQNEYPSGNPLHKVREVMSTCDGVMIVAYERKFIQKGFEKRGTAAQRELTELKYTTPWNHVESAIAFSLDLPLYIICESGLTEEGLIESKIDWFVQYIEFSPASLASPQVFDSIRAWVEDRVVPHAKRSKGVLPALATLKFSELTSHELYVLYALLAAVGGLGFVIGKFFPGFH